MILHASRGPYLISLYPARSWRLLSQLKAEAKINRVSHMPASQKRQRVAVCDLNEVICDDLRS